MAMEKYNEMREDGSLFSWAESIGNLQRAEQYRPMERSRQQRLKGLT